MIDSNSLFHSYVKIFIKDVYNLTHAKGGNQHNLILIITFLNLEYNMHRLISVLQSPD